MITVYLCFLAGGAVIPLVNFIAGFLNNDVDADVNTDADVDVDSDYDTNFNTDVDVDTDIDTEVEPDVNVGMDYNSDHDISTGLQLDHTVDHNIGSAAEVKPEFDSLISVGLLPSSLMSLSSLAITFGAVGSIMTLTGQGRILSFAAALISGYLTSVVVQTIIRSLKKAQTRNSGINENELLLYDGTVVDTILPGQLGSVSFVTLSGIRVSYPARCTDESLKLATGKVTKVKEIKNGVVIVEPKNRYE